MLNASLFAAEILFDRREIDFCSRRNLVHRGSLKPLVHKELLGRPQNAVAGVGGLYCAALAKFIHTFGLRHGNFGRKARPTAGFHGSGNRCLKGREFAYSEKQVPRGFYNNTLQTVPRCL